MYIRESLKKTLETVTTETFKSRAMSFILVDMDSGGSVNQFIELARRPARAWFQAKTPRRKDKKRRRKRKTVTAKLRFLFILPSLSLFV